MASTYRDHVVVCGLGKALGSACWRNCRPAGTTVLGIEKDENGRFLPHARQLGVTILVGDMKDDEVPVQAGIRYARAIVIATNDDMGNLEFALDLRRLNPQIRVVMGLFDESIASKIANAFLVDVAFSASTLAAPMVAAMSLGTKVLLSSLIAGIPHVSAELKVEPGSDLAENASKRSNTATAARCSHERPSAARSSYRPNPRPSWKSATCW